MGGDSALPVIKTNCAVECAYDLREREVWGRFVAEFDARMRAYLCKTFSGLSDDEIDERIADASHRAFERCATFKNGACAWHWFRKVLYNQTVDAFRKKMRRGEQLLLDLAEEWNEEAVDDLKAACSQQELIEWLQQEIDRLPERYRKVLELWSKNVRTNLIADELGITPDNVRHRLSRAFAKLRRRLKDFER